MTAVPSPAEAPEVWNSCDLGPYTWPPEPGEGGVLIAVTTAIDVDTQKPKGKDPAKSTTKGRKVASVKLDFTFTRRVWERGNEIRLALDPHGVNSGKAWDIRAPEPNSRNIDHVIIKSGGSLTINGDMYRFSLDADGWSEPKKAAVGGASTPKTSISTLDEDRARVAAAVAAQKAYAAGFTNGGASLPLGEIQPAGLDGPNAPNAEP